MNVVAQKTIAEIEIDIAELHLARHRLIEEKAGLQAQLSEIKAIVAVLMPKPEFAKVMRRRADIISRMSLKDREISAMKSQITAMEATKSVRKSQEKEFSNGSVTEVRLIRDKWHDFSMDSTNHQKAREVAWKMSQEINVVLKKYFQL